MRDQKVVLELVHTGVHIYSKCIPLKMKAGGPSENWYLHDKTTQYHMTEVMCVLSNLSFTEELNTDKDNRHTNVIHFTAAVSNLRPP